MYEKNVMKKLFKWVIRIVVVLLLLIVIAAFVLPMVIDPNDYKDTIEDKIQANIGRDAHLNGEIQWSVFPWLALTLNDVTLDNEKGFKGKNMAEIQQLSARIKLLPLLKKEVQIGKVSVDDATFTIQIAKNGRSNYQSMLDALDSGDTSTDTGSTSSPSGKLNIAGINLNNINLNYTDAQSKTTANISNLVLAVGNVTSNSPIDIDASMHLNMPDTGIDLDITAEVIAKNFISGTDSQLTINEFNIKGKLNKGSNMPLDISLQQAGIIHVAKDTLSFPEMVIAAGDANITTNLSGKNISKLNSSMSGAYSLSELDLNAFLTDLTGSAAVTTDILSEFSSSGKWSLNGKRFKIDDLAINFDETKIKGSADIKNLDKLSGNFKLHINKLDVDKFLGDEESNSSTSSDSGSNSDLNFGHLNGTIAIDSLTASGAKLDNIKVEVKTNGSKFELVPVKADFYQGLLSTSVKVDTKAVKNKVIVKHIMNKIQAGPLLTDLAGSEMLTGVGDLNIDLNIDKPFSEIPLKSAHGKLNYTLTDGAIYGVDVFGMMNKGLSMIYPEMKQEADDGVKKTNFALMLIDADVDQGILKTNTLKIESPYLQVNGDVTIDLVNMTIKGTIEPMLLDIPEQWVSDKYKKLLNLPIPVTLSGSLLEPSISIDAKKLLLASQKERIDKEKDKLKGKLLDSLFGKDKKKDKQDSTEENAEDNKSTEGLEKQEGETEDKKEEKKESSKDKLKKDLLKGLFGDG